MQATAILTSTLNLDVRVGVDKAGLRLINASMPGQLTIDSILQIVGLGTAPPGLGDLFTITDANIIFIPNKAGLTGALDGLAG